MKHRSDATGAPWRKSPTDGVGARGPGYLLARFSFLALRFAFKSCCAGFFEVFPPPLSLLATSPPLSGSSSDDSDRTVLSREAKRNDRLG